jgi:transposase
MVQSWRHRWLVAAPQLAVAEAGGGTAAELTQQIVAVLADAPRAGAPATFSAEQICQLLALACEPPAESARPVTHWTPAELAAEAVQRGLVPRISARTVGRFLHRRPISSRTVPPTG